MTRVIAVLGDASDSALKAKVVCVPIKTKTVVTIQPNRQTRFRIRDRDEKQFTVASFESSFGTFAPDSLGFRRWYEFNVIDADHVAWLGSGIESRDFERDLHGVVFL